MIQKLLLLVTFTLLIPTSVIFANESIHAKITDLVDAQSLKTHKKLLDVLFQYEDDFLDQNGSADLVKIIKVLKDNGLLQIFYKEPEEIKAKFTSKLTPLFIMKAVSDSLNKLGYHYILTHELKKEADTTEWTIIYSSEHAIDPVSLFEELSKYNITVDNIVKKGNLWEYLLDSKEPLLLDTSVLSTGTESKTFNDPRGEYWFRVDTNASVANIKSRSPDLWHPYIICYNADLNIMKMYKRDRSTRSLKFILPNETKYIKLTDMFTSENLKHGIEIQIEGAE